MKQSIQNRFFNDFPDIFPRFKASEEFGQIKFEFECDDGWEGIIRDLAVAIRDMNIPIEVRQVKQKLATLRFYYRPNHPAIDLLVHEAESKSEKTCEICGQPGSRRETRVTCEEHRNWRRTRGINQS